MQYAYVTVDEAKAHKKQRIRGGLTQCEGRLEGTQLYLTKREARQLGLRNKQQVAYWPAEEALQLGPYIGIMTNKRPGGLTGFRGLRGRRETYVALLRMAKNMGAVAFVFACEDIDFKRLRVTGYTRSKGGAWLARDYPLPNVVYNRVPDRKSEVSPVVRQTKQKIAALAKIHDIALFNPRFLNKWDLHRILERRPELRPYLPDTRVYRSPMDVLTMLKKHRVVYLKPRDTFAGQGIMRAVHKDGAFELCYKQGQRYRHERFSDSKGLLQAFNLRRHSGVYLVQQGLRLAKYKGGMFDARLLLQKNGMGTWELTGAGVRVAAKGGITTHVPNGGYIAPIEAVIGSVFQEPLDAPQGVYARVRKLALTIAPIIEEHYRSLFGEMSMDIGITEDGRCYFFEANAKPMKFDEPTIRQKSLKRLVEFSRYLSGYVPVEGSKYASN